MDYITTKEAAIKWGISDRRVLQYCNDNRIDRAVKMSNVWLIPKDAKKPADGRFKNGVILTILRELYQNKRSIGDE